MLGFLITQTPLEATYYINFEKLFFAPQCPQTHFTIYSMFTDFTLDDLTILPVNLVSFPININIVKVRELNAKYTSLPISPRTAICLFCVYKEVFRANEA